MKPQFDHEKLEAYRRALEFVGWGTETIVHTGSKIAAIDHFDRAMLGIPTNIVTGNSRDSLPDRIRFFDAAYGSMLECAACLDVLAVRSRICPETVEEGKRQLSSMVGLIIGLRRVQGDQVSEPRAVYSLNNERGGKVWFDHERLDVYSCALDFVAWAVHADDTIHVPKRFSHDLDRDSTGIPLNIAEGNGKFPGKDRCRFLGYAETHALQAAKDIDLLVATKRVRSESMVGGKGLLVRIVSMVRGMKRKLADS